MSTNNNVPLVHQPRKHYDSGKKRRTQEKPVRNQKTRQIKRDAFERNMENLEKKIAEFVRYTLLTGEPLDALHY